MMYFSKPSRMSSNSLSLIFYTKNQTCAKHVVSERATHLEKWMHFEPFMHRRDELAHRSGPCIFRRSLYAEELHKAAGLSQSKTQTHRTIASTYRLMDRTTSAHCGLFMCCRKEEVLRERRATSCDARGDGTASSAEWHGEADESPSLRTHEVSGAQSEREREKGRSKVVWREAHGDAPEQVHGAFPQPPR